MEDKEESERNKALLILGFSSAAILGIAIWVVAASWPQDVTQRPADTPAVPPWLQSKDMTVPAPAAEMTTSDRVAFIMKALEKFTAGDRETLILARDRYREIPASDECRRDVRKAVTLLIKREGEYERNAKLAARMAGEVTRKIYARELERTLLDESIEVAVSLVGENKTTIVIESFICGRVFFHKTFEKPEMYANLARVGMRRIVCKNAFDSLSMDLPNAEDPAPNSLPSMTAAPRCAESPRKKAEHREEFELLKDESDSRSGSRPYDPNADHE